MSKVESNIVTNGIHDDISKELKIKEEPQDVDYVILNDQAKCD